MLIAAGRGLADRVRLAGCPFLSEYGVDCEASYVEDLLDARLAHCYGHTYSDPLLRLAFQRALAAELDDDQRARIGKAAFTACLATTDVHEYGKALVQSLLGRLGVEVVDAGVSVDPDVLARTAHTAGADFIAISSYNGIALGFVDDLNRTLAALGLKVPVYIGGKLNQVPEYSNTSLPVDIRAQLRRAGALPCDTVSEMLSHLAALAREKSGAGTV